MRKIILTSCVVASSLFATISDDKIVEIYKAPGLNAKVLKREKLADTNYEQVEIEISKDKESQKMVVFTDGKYLISDIVDIDKKISYRYEYEKKAQDDMMKGNYGKLGDAIKKLDKTKIVSLGNDKNKPTEYIFTDPLCPYCQNDLVTYRDLLKEKNLKLIFAPIPSHGDEAVFRSLAIQKEVKDLKNDEEKLKIIEKYYSKDTKVPAGFSSDDLKKEKEIIDSIFKTGAIMGVPAHIEEKELKK